MSLTKETHFSKAEERGEEEDNWRRRDSRREEEMLETEAMLAK